MLCTLIATLELLESLFGSTSFISSISDQQPQVQVYNEDFNLKVTGKDTPSKVFLCESNTNVLFTIMGSVMSSDTIDYVAVREMNILMERKPKTIEKIDRSTETVYRGVRVRLFFLWFQISSYNFLSRTFLISCYRAKV